MTESSVTGTSHAPRCVDVPLTATAALANAIVDLYEQRTDVLVVRGALPAAQLAPIGLRLDAGHELGWERPNERMPPEDIQLLGTDTPATPTYRCPQGPSLNDYLDSAAKHHADADQAIGPGFDFQQHLPQLLRRFSGGRDVRVPRAVDGREYVPYTLRRLAEHKQIGIHHDRHFRLRLYEQLAEIVDTRTLVSWVITIQAPEEGGELFVYNVTPDTPNAPKLPNGFQFDLAAIEQRYGYVKLIMQAGDLFLLASGTYLHRVGRILGPRARITVGGFLALERSGEQVLYWS